MYHQPTSIEQALDLKGRFGASASFLAGGTDLVVGVRKGRRRLDEVIDLSRVDELAQCDETEGVMRIGAMCRLARLESSSIGALAAACATVGGPQIRNLGTIGGQIHTASPAGDVSVALIALDAEVELASAGSGRRKLALADLFVGPGSTSMADDEMITAVFVPADRRSNFYKIGKRNAVAISLVMGAASLTPDGRPAISLGCVAPTPLRLRRVEAHLAACAVLESDRLNRDVVEEAARLAEQEVRPIDDHRGSAAYRRAMAGAITRRLLIGLMAPG